MRANISSIFVIVQKGLERRLKFILKDKLFDKQFLLAHRLISDRLKM